ncbi:MFS transporter [Mycobacterium tuberculosis]
MVGNTPVLWIPELSGTSDPDRGFWAKLEGFNPGGMKDRPALYMVECARARGDIAPGAAIVESTSGTLGLGLALAGKVYRHPVTLVTDPGLEPIIARMLTAYGAGVDMVTQPHPVGGWQQARKDRVAQLMAEYPGAWNPNQYGNPDNVGAYRSLALELVAIFRGFNRPSRVLMINQFGINIGFYMLMPYLADYLAGPLGLAAWAVGLVMGVRNFSQQGMFFVGGTLADRFGYKPLIIAGCLIRTGGFALLVVAQSLPSVLIAAAATGFAGALFNPAVRGYLAAEAGERKIEAFAMFNVFYQSGILLGPLVGLVLLALDFRITVLAAAGVFGLLTVAQLVALPQHRADSEREKTSILQDWRVVVRNRPFLTLAAAMTGCYALSFQIYLALPMQASILMPRNQYLLIAAMFAVSGLVAVGGQLRITRWFAVRWGAERSLVVGATILAASFIPVAVIPNGQRFGVAVAVMALVLSASLLAVASAALFPFEMRAVVALSGDRLVATHYGFYSTIVGVGVLVGNLAIGSLMSAARRLNTDEIVWGGLILVGIVAVAGLRRLDTFTSGSQNMTGRWAAPR